MNELLTRIAPDKHFEGCGHQGPLRSVLLAEFHAIQGPIIRCQSSPEIVTKEIFDAISVYIIPKRELAGRTVTVTASGVKIIGCPIVLDDSSKEGEQKYKRNQFMFNICFVCYPWSRTVLYEPSLSKLSKFLVNLELENNFLYDPSEERLEQQRRLLQTIFEELNREGSVSITLEHKVLKLKIMGLTSDPVEVLDHHVPVWTLNEGHSNHNKSKKKGRRSGEHEKWNLTSEKIIPFINGFNHVQKIALLANVDMKLVKTCLQNLIFLGVIRIAPIFSFSNSYCVTPKVRQLLTDVDLRSRLLNCAVQGANHNSTNEVTNDNNGCNRSMRASTLRSVYAFLCSFNHGADVKQLWQRARGGLGDVSVGALVQFAVIEGLLRRVHCYPFQSEHGQRNEVVRLEPIRVNLQRSTSQMSESCSDLYHLLNGRRSLDEIGCLTGSAISQLKERLEADPSVVMLRR